MQHTGSDTLTLTTDDQGNTGLGGALSDNDSVLIAVSAPENKAPEAADDNFSTSSAMPFVIEATSLLANDRDADGDKLRLVSWTQPKDGSVKAYGSDTEGVSSLVFRSNPGYTGDLGFDYTVRDSSGATDVGHVTVRVVAPPQQNRFVDITGETVDEGNAGSTPLRYTITLTTSDGLPPAQDITVPWGRSGGTATRDVDYTGETGGMSNITWMAGTVPSGRTHTFSYNVLGDTVPEPDETVVVSLGGIIGGMVGVTNTATGTIRNDDVWSA